MLSTEGNSERVMPMGLAIDRELAFRSKQMERGQSLQSTTELGFSLQNRNSPDPPAEMVDSLLSERRLSRKRLREATTKLVISQTQGGVVPVEEEMQREEERVSVESPPQMPPLQGSGKAGQSQSSASSPKTMLEKIPDGAEDKLLYNQDNHILEGIIHGEELGRFRCIPTNPDKEVWVLTNTQREYVRQAGLQHLAEIDRMVIDHALITGLIERWRPETNSFHFPSGEATITLEDVAYIYGLPIEGPVVVGRTFPNALVQSVCEDLLGITPRPGVDFVGISLKFKWLEDNFKLSEKKKMSEDNEIRATRAYLFFLVAGQICTQASGARGPAYLLELFKEFKPYAWAPACLANLYRMLAKATWWNREKKEGEEEGEDKKGQDKRVLRTLTGPLQLLQIWAYSRMSIGRCPPPDDNWRKDIQFPLFKTWSRRLEDHSALTTIKEVRKQLNNMTVDGFNWQPYAGYGKKFLQHVPKVDRDLFSSSTVLIFYWIVERHNTCRVMKQFGFKQVVPPPFNMPFLRHERVERITIDYRKIEDGIEALWQDRRNMVLHGEKCTSSEHSDEYLVWYGFNTISHVGRRDRSETSNTEGSTKRNESFAPKKHVLELFELIERSCDRADHRKTSIGKLTKSIRKKIKTFKAAFGMACENFSMEACSNSRSEHDVEKLGLIIMSDKGKSKETDDIDHAHWSDGPMDRIPEDP
ncbi:hypothetical protein AAC387_Pa02g1692 [Persea americana]